MSVSALERLIGLVKRRLVLIVAIDQGTVALTAAMAGVILLLVTGTQILTWWIPVALFFGAAGLGLWRVRRRIPGEYQVAQKIDHALGLHDSLSTAWHFRATDLDVFSAAVKQLQREQAERAAATIDPAAAFPFRWPAGIRPLVAVSAIAMGLFLVRYGVQESLDLSRPLVAFELDPFGGSANAKQAANRPKPSSPLEEFLQTVSVQPPETKEEGLDPAPDSALGVVDVPDVNNDNAESPGVKTGEKGPGTTDKQENGESGEQGDGASSGDPKSADNNPASTSDAQQQKGAPPNKNQQPSPQNDSSMLDKMKDAFANLMNKLNAQPKQQEGGQPQSAQNQKGSQPSGNARQQASKQGMQAKGQQSGEQQQSSNQPGDQDSQESDPAQAAQGKPGDRNSTQAANQENKSGMGKQDGDKDVKLAEQMAAMGKLSEIIGKRNEKLQGEVMLEVNSSKQALRTQYSQRNARHAESGAEIRRDEVPLVYQPYVQQYFEEVRKPARGSDSKH